MICHSLATTAPSETTKLGRPGGTAAAKSLHGTGKAYHTGERTHSLKRPTNACSGLLPLRAGR